MAKIRLEVWGYRCERCDHEWVPRSEVAPRVCPKCKSPYWDRPRKKDEKVVGEEEAGDKRRKRVKTG